MSKESCLQVIDKDRVVWSLFGKTDDGDSDRELRTERGKFLLLVLPISIDFKKFNIAASVPYK